MTIHIEKETEVSFDFEVEQLINKVIEAALEYEDCPYETEINVVLTNNEEIKEINKEYREIDAPTDVLSFPMVEFLEPSDFSLLEEEQKDCFHPDTGELMLGDIIVSVDKVSSQAKEFNHSEKRELGFLIAHSMLHLCGYDHMEEEEREVMEARQRAILDRIGLSR